MPWQNSPADRRQSSTTYGREWKTQRLAALKRDGRCVLCGNTKKLTVDHITPISQGGTHQLTNLRTLCQQCHSKVTAQQGRGYRQQHTDHTDPAPRPATTW